LITSGSIAIVGGIVTFGLSVAVRQLRRIADALARPVPASAPRRQPAAEVGEGAPPPRRPPGPPGPYPPRPDAREPRPDVRPPLAPPPPPAPAMEAPEPPPMERPRPNIFGAARATGESSDAEEPDTVPLAPNRALTAPIGRGGPPPAPERMSEPPQDPRSTPE